MACISQSYSWAPAEGGLLACTTGLGAHRDTACPFAFLQAQRLAGPEPGGPEGSFL